MHDFSYLKGLCDCYVTAVWLNSYLKGSCDCCMCDLHCSSYTCRTFRDFGSRSYTITTCTKSKRKGNKVITCTLELCSKKKSDHWVCTQTGQNTGLPANSTAKKISTNTLLTAYSYLGHIAHDKLYCYIDGVSLDLTRILIGCLIGHMVKIKIKCGLGRLQYKTHT